MENFQARGLRGEREREALSCTNITIPVHLTFKCRVKKVLSNVCPLLIFARILKVLKADAYTAVCRPTRRASIPAVPTSTVPFFCLCSLSGHRQRARRHRRQCRRDGDRLSVSGTYFLPICHQPWYLSVSALMRKPTSADNAPCARLIKGIEDKADSERYV